MSGCRFRYEDLPAPLKARVDALAERGTALAGTAGAVGVSQTAEREARGRRQPNKTEAGYRAEVLGRRGDVAAVHYEGLTLRMANGHRYTPDWVVVTVGGRIECHEVKGGHAMHSEQRARLAFDQARVEFPWIVWVWARKVEGGGWMVDGPGSRRGMMAET